MLFLAQALISLCHENAFCIVSFEIDPIQRNTAILPFTANKWKLIRRIIWCGACMTICKRQSTKRIHDFKWWIMLFYSFALSRRAILRSLCFVRPKKKFFFVSPVFPWIHLNLLSESLFLFILATMPHDRQCDVMRVGKRMNVSKIRTYTLQCVWGGFFFFFFWHWFFCYCTYLIGLL